MRVSDQATLLVASLLKPDGSAPASKREKAPGDSVAPTEKPGLELSPELDEAARQTLRELKARDREVRAHEAAHTSVGGSLAGGASFTYETGPDGKAYAVAGEVSIRLGSGGTPEQKIANARQARAAALAPADPSGPDRAIAAKATRIEADARAELAREAREEQATTEEAPPPAEPAEVRVPDAQETRVRQAYDQQTNDQQVAQGQPLILL